MEKKEIKKVFLRFLKNNNCYSQFIKRFNCKKGVSDRTFWANGSHKMAFMGTINNGFQSYLNNIKSNADLLQYAFLWEKTDEGHEFWQAIGNEWRKELKKIN